MKTGIELIQKERQEQLNKHNRTVENDVKENNHYQLSTAAGLLCWVDEEDYDNDIDGCCPVDWDNEIWRHMMQKPYEERLIIAGALIAAEIDRLNNIKLETEYLNMKIMEYPKSQDNLNVKGPLIPKVGDIVSYFPNKASNKGLPNSMEYAPAIITQIFGDPFDVNCANITLFTANPNGEPCRQEWSVLYKRHPLFQHNEGCAYFDF